jgi:hypothetical protein
MYVDMDLTYEVKNKRFFERARYIHMYVDVVGTDGMQSNNFSSRTCASGRSYIGGKYTKLYLITKWP